MLQFQNLYRAGATAALALLALLTASVEAALMPGSLIIGDNDVDAIVALNPITLERTIISDASTGVSTNYSGSFSAIDDVIIGPSGNLYVLDDTFNAVISVDPVTGDRTVISDNSSPEVGTGDPIGTSNKFTFGPDGLLYLTDSTSTLDGIRVIDPATGNRTVLSSESADMYNGTNADPEDLVFIDGVLYGTDNRSDSVYTVDLVTGVRTEVPGLTGASLSSPNAMHVTSDGVIVVGDAGLDAIVLVDLVAGTQTILSDDSSVGPDLASPNALEVGDDGIIYVADSGTGVDMIFAIDPVTGDRTVIGSDTIGTGPYLSNADALTIVPGIAVPEPTTGLLAGLGLLLAGFARRRSC